MNNQSFHPMLVSAREGSGDSDEVFFDRWKSFDALPDRVKGVLTSPKILDSLMDFSQKYDLSDVNLRVLSRCLRSFYFGILAHENDVRSCLHEAGFPEKIIMDATRLIVRDSRSFPSGLSDNDNPDFAQESLGQLFLNLVDIFKQFPSVADQIITSSPIVFESNGQSARPTVSNWVKYYEEILGVGTHGVIDRGNFLFHDRQTKNLSDSDRQKLSTILKSLDENVKLPVDSDKQEIIFGSNLQNFSVSKQSLRNNVDLSVRPVVSNHHVSASIVPTQTDKRFEEVPGSSQPVYPGLHESELSHFRSRYTQPEGVGLQKGLNPVVEEGSVRYSSGQTFSHEQQNVPAPSVSEKKNHTDVKKRDSLSVSQKHNSVIRGNIVDLRS
ncbi:MAG: hypothetical protein KC736_03480 [Candidatus Moranbacteria bacterium]|nr:hypothetical protein [Candidatus Moranbacteria bacterium]